MDCRRGLALLLALVLSVLVVLPVGAGGGLTATEAGVAITLSEASHLSCHDIDYPTLRCFESSEEMHRDALLRFAAAARVAIGILDVGYVIVYEHATYGGSSLLLSSDQAWLTDIGWNDRISSFKSFGGTGNFRENSPGSGFSYAFGPTSMVSALSGTYNDKFSAFYLN